MHIRIHRLWEGSKKYTSYSIATLTYIKICDHEVHMTE